jgi:hypothetical protein
MPGALAGSPGNLLVSQGNGTSPQWQSFDFNAIADARIDLQKGVPDGLASLDATGKVPSSQLPAIAITNTFVATFLDSPGGVIDSCTEHVATVGDFCVVTSVNKSYVLSATPANIVGNWVELLSSSSGVTSVNGQTGNVSLTAANGLTLVGETSFQLGGTLNSATTIEQAGHNISLSGTGNLGVGVAVPTQKVDISGNLQFSGALMPAGSGGNSGELLVSQGGSSAPQWTSPANIALGVVRDATTNQGLVRSGAGNPGNPYTLGLQPCSTLQMLIFNGAGWDCGNQQTYSAGTGLTLINNTFNLTDTGVAPGTYGSASQYPILSVDAQGRITTAGLGTVPNYIAGTGISLDGSTFNNTGLLTVTGTGAITATSGQNPVIAFADGTSNGQVWAWDGSSWQLTTQSFTTGTAGSNFNIVSGNGSHVFNLPDAGPASRGVVSTASQTFTGVKTFDTQLAVASGGLLVLNGTAGADPTGTDGSMYYNSTMNKFRCFEASVWKDCISSGQQPWTACAPLTISATNTAPTKAAVTNDDCMRYRFIGAKTIIVDFIYSTISATGTTAGAGDYLFQLPPGTSYDVAEHPFYTGPLDNESAFVAAAPFVIRGDFPGQVRSAPNGGSGGTTFVVPYDATHFRIVADQGNNIRAVGSANQPLNQAGYTIIGRFNMEIP